MAAMSDGLDRVDQGTEVARTRRLYRRVAPVYDAFRGLWSRATRATEATLDDLFRERVGPTTRILELAPGTGTNLERLQRVAPAFASYLGIDSSQAMLDRARAKAGADGRVRLSRGDATALDSVPTDFDFIVCTWLLSHLDAPAECVRGALTRLSPEGTAVFVFLTEPERPLLRRVLGYLGAPLRYGFVDRDGIRDIPGLERLEVDAGGMATLAVFRRPGSRA